MDCIMMHTSLTLWSLRSRWTVASPSHGITAGGTILIDSDATEADIDEIVSLLNELGYKISPNTLAVQLRHYKLPKSTVLVAACLASNRLVGLFSGLATPLLHQTGFLGRITTTIVSSELRCRGVGRKLGYEL